MTYDQGLWFIICSVVTGLGVIGAFFTFARKGPVAGFRILGWALLPLAAALTGIVGLLFKFGTAIANFIGSFVVSTQVWVGLAMFVFAFVLLGGSAFLRRRRLGAGDSEEAAPATEAGSRQENRPREVEKGKKKKQEEDPLEGFEDIEEILKNRGIS